MILSQVAAAKDMYEKAAKEMEDLLNLYDEFYTPFLKDMERYQQMVNGVQNLIQNAYDSGIDVLRSPEGRRILYQAKHLINPGELNAMKANAKLGYAYLEAMQNLRKSGKYSEALELFDIAQSNGTQFSDFLTSRDGGGFNMWTRTSPIESTSLRDLTYKYYEHRTPRNLTREDFINDPALAGVPYDNRYTYTGYLDSDLMNVAPGASASLVGDPRAEFFRDVAKQKVLASGQPITDENIEAQFLRDIADANTWALVEPIKTADDFAKMDYSFNQQVKLKLMEHENEMEKAIAEAQLKGGRDDRYSASMNMVVDSEGNMKRQLSNYIDPNISKKLSDKETKLNVVLNDIAKNPQNYSKEKKEFFVKQYNNLVLERDGAGMEGVARLIKEIAKKNISDYFTSIPEDINNILRNLSSRGALNTIGSFLSNLGGAVDSDGGVYINNASLCGVGEVAKDVLARGVLDGKKHKDTEDAIKLFDGGELSRYNVSWTAGAFDIRNETNDTNPLNSGESKFWPTGNVLSGHQYYYIEVANNPNDFDECCWFKIDRDVANLGGINPVISSISQVVDDSFMHTFSNSNVIGNAQSAVKEYNK